MMFRKTFAMLALALGASAPAHAATFALDADHSFAYFKIVHLKLTKVIGRFNQVAGTVTLNDAGLLTAADITIQAASVDTGVPRRDNHLRSTDFFNAAQFPTLKFHATNAVSIDASHQELTGDFTLHGVTKTVTAQATQIGLGVDSTGKGHVGAEAAFTFKRSDFGMTTMLGDIGDDIEVFLSFDGVKQ